MKKADIVELGVESLAGGDVVAEIRGKYHPAVVERFLGMAFTDILQVEFDNSGADYSVFDSLTKTFFVTVSENESIGKRYVKLPITLIPLRPKHACIRSISLRYGQNKAFAPISNTSVPIWSEMEAMRVDSTCSYMIENGTVVFEHNPPPVGAELMLKLIPSFEDYDDEDDVVVPGGQNKPLFDKMYEIMQRRGNRDLNINDANSTQNLSNG